MGKDTYLVFDFEDSREVSSIKDLKGSYDPRRREEVKIEFIVPPLKKSGGQKEPEQKKVKETYPETDRRQGSERRAEFDRRMGSSNRRSWQESRWIGAPDCRSGVSDRRRKGDRRKNPDRRRK